MNMVVKKKSEKKKSNFSEYIYGNFRDAVRDVRFLNSYISFATTLFIVVTLIGMFFPVFFKEQIIELVKEIIAQTEGLGPVELTRFIMANNIKSSFFAMIFGVLFGLIPLGVIIVNAYVLGFVVNQSVAIEGPLIIWRLFPHGIFEIPAILISVAMGLRLGLFLFVYRGRKKVKSF